MKEHFDRLFQRFGLGNLPRLKRFIIAMIGVGICMIVLPGPAVVVIPIGLAILATEFVWARIWLQKAKALGTKAAKAFKG